MKSANTPIIGLLSAIVFGCYAGLIYEYQYRPCQERHLLIGLGVCVLWGFVVDVRKWFEK